MKFFGWEYSNFLAPCSLLVSIEFNFKCILIELLKANISVDMYYRRKKN